jgi:hypothetical protein
MPSWNDGESSDDSLLSGFSEGHDFSPRPPVCMALGLGFVLIWDLFVLDSSNSFLKFASSGLL